MSGKFLLKQSEIRELTGTDEVKLQTEWFAQRGYCFDIGIDGCIKVLREHVTRKMGESAIGISSKRKHTPNFAVLMR
jgi:hypothetical protein